MPDRSTDGHVTHFLGFEFDDWLKVVTLIEEHDPDACPTCGKEQRTPMSERLARILEREKHA